VPDFMPFSIIFLAISISFSSLIVNHEENLWYKFTAVNLLICWISSFPDLWISARAWLPNILQSLLDNNYEQLNEIK
jgi:hypothetical protein